MKFSYQRNYNSITQFEPFELPNFAILTGLNGSGKTHLLEALKNGAVAIEGINNAELVYYNYNDFVVFAGRIQESPTSQNRVGIWNSEKRTFLGKIHEFKNKVSRELMQSLTATDQLIFTTSLSSDFDFDSWYGNPNDYEEIEKIGRMETKLPLQFHSFRKNFTDTFFEFANVYLNRAKGNIEDLKLNLLKPRFEKAILDLDQAMKIENPELYEYLKSSLLHTKFNSISEDDFESPNFFLEEIIDAEKDYQLMKTQNSLNQIKATEWQESTGYMTKAEFIAKNGLSPVELINDVLNEYDCNGYFLTTTRIDAKIGIDASQLEMNIKLRHKEDKYETMFDQLSSGEKTLIALAILIYKSQKKKIIPRMLLLDEIDSSLHPSMITRLLNVIQNVFIANHGLKVILATHSPTTVALSPDESIFVVNKKGTEKVSKQAKSDAIQILTEGIATLNVENTNLSIEYNISQTSLPVLFTEGITDKIILETAWKKNFPGTPMPFYIQDCFDASFLANLFRRGYDQQDGIFINHSDKKLIALFDFDKEGYDCWHSIKKSNANKFDNVNEDDPLKGLTITNSEGNAHALLLPVPDNGIVKKQVIKSGKETFRNQSRLSIELLFYGDKSFSSAFSKESVSGGGEIIVFNGNKRDFAAKASELQRDDFRHFLQLFIKIQELIK